MANQPPAFDPLSDPTESASLEGRAAHLIAGEAHSESLFAGYAPREGYYDEMFGPAGEARPHVANFCALMNRLGRDETSRRWDHSQRLIYENGIAYSAYGDPQENARPWQLDPLPVLIDHDEWKSLSAGLVQRAQLLDLVLQDLFGPQRLVKEGILPPSLVYGHPGFHVSFCNILAPRVSHLNLYAADLGRSEDGKWHLLADRSEAPSGAGFALENRVVLSRMLPESFRAMRVRRLAPYFIALREHLRRLAPTHRDNPRVAILSQGPQHINYFEDAYLARYLGYTLAEGADLAVRNNAVWLKTLDGLQPIDVLWRRANSDACDPLETPGDGESGVAGLTLATSLGNLALSNPLGSGLVESPALMAFLPQIARRLLGSDLQLPGVATWWCGDAASRQYVLEHLEELAVRPAFRRRSRSADQRHALGALSTSELATLIRDDPAAYVGQQRMARSTSPWWHGERLEPTYLTLRAFAVRSAETYLVMEGGLARTSPRWQSLDAAFVSGEGSKDTWIVGQEPVASVSLLPKAGEPVRLRRTGADLPSRVADNLFWLGRQIERADAAARLLRIVAMRLTSEGGGARGAVLPTLLRALADQGQIEPGYAVDGMRDRLPDIEGALPDAVFDTSQLGSLRSRVDQLLRVGRQVRDRLSVDSWRVMVRIDRNFRRQEVDSCNLTDLLNLTNELIIDLAAISGMVSESMTRTHVFRFLDLGRRLERAWQLVRLLQTCLQDSGQRYSSELLEAVLEIADSVMTYRARYLANLQLTAVLDLLLTDSSNPRGVAFQLGALSEHIDRLPRRKQQATLDPEQRAVLDMVHAVRMFDVVESIDETQLDTLAALERLLTDLNEQLPRLSHILSNRYLVHSGPMRQLNRATRP